MKKLFIIIAILPLMACMSKSEFDNRKNKESTNYDFFSSKCNHIDYRVVHPQQGKDAKYEVYYSDSKQVNCLKARP